MSEYPYDLGPYSRQVTTTSPEAQAWFDRGLNWTYGYNQDEAVRCFERALEHDPGCAMAAWGLAYVQGPYLNKEWRFFSDQELVRLVPSMHLTAARAVELASTATPVEQAICKALLSRYPTPVVPPRDQLTDWDHDFARAMAVVHHQFPNDRDVIAVYVEAMMMRTPWKLWDLTTGEPAADADTVRMVDVLEQGFALSASNGLDTHPGMAHMMCHTMEMSHTPEKALKAADSLRELAPSNGHLLHMPGHIDALCGNWSGAVVTSVNAIAADMAYLDQVGPYGQYTAAICHDNHLLMFAAMFLGRWSHAIEAADTIDDIVTEEVLLRSTPAFQITLEAYRSMRPHVFVRFGKWAEILSEPLPDDPSLLPVTTAMSHYARGVAHANLGDPQKAAASLVEFDAIRSEISGERHFFNNTAQDVLAIAHEMMCGEMAYHGGAHELGLDHLREAVRLDDSLNYTEPWAWMHPPRHALGALLLDRDQVEEAEQVYRTDLGLGGPAPRANVHPSNVWALHGYVECLERLDREDEADEWRARRDRALVETDIHIHSSCACRPVSEKPCCH